jgi:molybdopterin converting factor small subunit
MSTSLTTPMRRTAAARVAGVPVGCRRTGTLGDVATVRLFAAARDAAGTGRDEFPGATVAEVLDAARARYGQRFEEVLATSRVWVNGEPVDARSPVGPHDELAVLPPVSGGAW